MKKINRQEFFQEAFQRIARKTLKLLEGTKIKKIIDKLEYNDTQLKQRPPGASSNDGKFLEQCTGCDRCMSACPVNVIMIEDLTKRYPIIYPDTQPCILCPGFPCIASCPSNALELANGLTPKRLH